MKEIMKALSVITTEIESGIRHGGVRIRAQFPNGYGASIIRNPFSYGGDEGLWELAVLGKDGDLCYDTPITSDVLGWLEAEEVIQACLDIAAL